MSKKKPVIGVTGPVKGGLAAWLFTAFGIWLQGGNPVRIYPGKSLKGVKLNGLVLGGGADINPERYGELLEENAPADKPKPHGLRAWMIRIASIIFYPILFLLRNIFSAKATGIATGRDDLEFDLLDEACNRRIPVLGICRGMQLINVKFGGTLHQDISGYYTEVPKIHTIRAQKTVSLDEQSVLYKIVQSPSLMVNALHNQAVDRLGESVAVSAREDSGITQAIEHPGYDYLLGVQWHPEYLPQIPHQRRIFKAFVEKANVNRESEISDVK